MSITQKEKDTELIADKSTEMKNEPKNKEFLSPSNINNKQNTETSMSPSRLKPKLDRKNKEELKFFGVSEYYIKGISDELISKYGNYFLKTFDQKNLDIPPVDFLSRHKINPSIRTKMVNWMLEVFHSFKSNEETIFSAVKILDKYIWKTEDVLKNEDIHLIGIVCMYLASKTYDIVPIQMNNLTHLVGHDIFEQKSIKEMEKKILKTINFDLITPNTYEFIQFLLYDFYINNKESIEGLNLKKMFDILENCSIWLAKMCNHFEKYSSVSPIFLSVSCVMIAYDMMKDNCKLLNENMQKFFKDWLKFLFTNIAKTPENKNEIEKIYKSIGISYNDFEKMNLKNLVQYHELYFN